MSATEPLPTVAHLVGQAGTYSQVWIDAQVCASERYAPTLWALTRSTVPYYWRSRPVPPSGRRAAFRFVARLPQPVQLGGGRLPDLARLILGFTADGRESPTVYHAHFGQLAYVWSAFAAVAHRQLVTSFYGFDACAARYRTVRWRARYARLFAASAAVIAEGPHMAARLAELGCPPERLHVVRLPFVPAGVLDDIPRAEIEYAACFGGRFVAKKGVDIALRAFARAFHHGRERMLLVGMGPAESRLRTLAAELGLADRAVFHPPVPLQEFATLLRSVRVALFPSLTSSGGDGEGGAPLAIPLAQFLGVPIIVSDHDDLPWAAAPGTAVVPSGDVEALAAALAATYASSCAASTQLARHVQTAREFVGQAYDPRRLTREREAVYDVAAGR